VLVQVQPRSLTFRTRSLDSEAPGFYPDEQGAHPCGFTIAPQTTNQQIDMKLTKALKHKNQLAGELTDLKERLAKQNCRASTVPFDYDTNEVLVAIRQKMDELIIVKSAIALANVAIYPLVFRLAELKGLVVAMKSLDTRQGVFKEGASYSQAPYEIEYTAQIKKATVDILVTEFEAEIATIQDQLDEFNQTHFITLSA
jgi:hypothetical protein